VSEPQNPQSEPTPATPPAPAAPGAEPAQAAPAAPPEGGGERSDRGERGDHRGGGRGRGPGGRGRGRDRDRDRGDREEGGLEERVVAGSIRRCAAVVKGGRRFSFSALVVVGDRKGQVGIGFGKANEVPPAVEKAKKAAMRSLKKVPLQGGTIPHPILGRFGASEVKLLPASPGTGVIAGSSARAVLELAGVRDVLTKAYGSTNVINTVKATLQALMNLRSKDAIEALRGVPVEQIVKGT
jgi:small subunit ribosomal protein S5